ncbi:MAG TPA: DUF58 domain-containing protein [Candidatus Binatia bacterium]|nr:DUF58 domain-containing protein [Candidatus Binatia bacterium]
MSLEFRIPGLSLRKEKANGKAPAGHAGKPRFRILESLESLHSRFRRLVHNDRRWAHAEAIVGRRVQPLVNSAPDTRHPTPEIFFDTEFLKKLERLRLVAKRLAWANAKGEHSSSRRGFSLEFSDYRKYQQGDDLRYVDWNIYRRLDRLLLKVFTADEEMNVYLLVDTSRSMAEGTPPKIDYARKVAAALGYIGLKNLDRVGGASFSAALHAPLTLGRGRKQVLGLFSFLSKLSCHGETNLRTAIHSFTNLFPHPGLAIIISDLFDPAGWRAALEELATKKYQLLVIHILDPQEISPKPWGDVALNDVESGRERRFFLDPDLIRRFQEELEGYFNEIETVCSSRRIDYLKTTTELPFDEFVLQTLRQVSSVR